MLSDYFNKIKLIFYGLVASVIGILTLLFFYEKRKADVNEALAQEEKVNADLAKTDAVIQTNDAQLKAEEQTREAIAKEQTNVNPSSQDVVDDFNRRNNK